MADRYPDFAALAAAERRGRDYNIIVREVAGSPVAVVAPHGGGIEKGTSEVAAAIAAGDCNLYIFEGHAPNAWRLHITSTNFDEPDCRALVARAAIVVTVHGCHYFEGDETAWLGGRDTDRRDAIGRALRDAGFAAETDTTFPGRDPRNICNRGTTGGGVQLELARALRRKLRREHDLRARFADAVRSTF